MAPFSEPLEELAPSPIDETPSSFQNGYFPATHSSFLGISNHSLTYYLHRAQRYSSYTFSAFLALHVTNTSILPLVTSDPSKYLLLTRPYYQSWPIAEPLLVIAPLATHIISGVALRLHRRRLAVQRAGAESRREKRTIKWPALSGTSALGLAAVPLVLTHVALNRILPLRVEGGSSGIGLDFVGHGVAIAPFLGWCAYTALVSVVGFHVVWGWAKWLALNPEATRLGDGDVPLRRKRRWWGVNGAAAALVAMWLSGGVGVVARGGKVAGWVGRQYDELYRKIPVLGGWVSSSAA